MSLTQSLTQIFNNNSPLKNRGGTNNISLIKKVCGVATTAVSMALAGLGCGSNVDVYKTSCMELEQIALDSCAYDCEYGDEQCLQVCCEASPSCECTGEPEDKLLTKGEYVRSLVGGVMGYDLSGPCEVDIFDVPNDTPLCSAIDILKKRGITLVYPDGSFGAGDTLINWVEVLKGTSQALGFPNDKNSCLYYVSDADPESWFHTYAGAFCAKGYTVFLDDALLHPNDNVTYGRWSDIKDWLTAYFKGKLNKAVQTELIFAVLGGQTLSSDFDCDSYYGDVPDDSAMCQMANYGVNFMGIDPSTVTNFEPHKKPQRGWMANTFVNYSLGLDQSQYCSGCSGGDEWWCQWGDPFCDNGLAENGWLAGNKVKEIPSRLEAYGLAWDTQMSGFAFP
jgi:hypothetical protein